MKQDRPFPNPPKAVRAEGGRKRWAEEFAYLDRAVLALIADRPEVTLGEIVDVLTARRVLDPLRRPVRRCVTVALSLRRLEKAGKIEYLGEKPDAAL